MTSKLDQLRDMTTVVADTGDIEAVARLKPVDCTTNPTIVLKALGTPTFADAIKEAVSWGKKQGGNSPMRLPQPSPIVLPFPSAPRLSKPRAGPRIDRGRCRPFLRH